LSTLQILILALVQGLTEFLPVSSSAHLILASEWLGWPDQGQVFDVAVHLGSLFAVTLYFRRDLVAMLTGGAIQGFAALPGRTLLLWLAIATIPLGLVGLFGAGWIETHLRSATVIAWASIGFGLLLWVTDAGARRRADGRPLGWIHVIGVGLAQVLALIPGTSRSGITITAGLALGLDRQRAARFSFLLAIPALGAAGLYGVVSMLEQPPLAWTDFALALVAAFFGAWACIGAFLRLVDRIGMAPFVIYRVALGVALLALAW
jgi:undecaprenyl-diphosphatase